MMLTFLIKIMLYYCLFININILKMGFIGGITYPSIIFGFSRSLGDVGALRGILKVKFSVVRILEATFEDWDFWEKTKEEWEASLNHYIHQIKFA